MRTCAKCQTTAPAGTSICHECGADFPKLERYEVTFLFANSAPVVTVRAESEAAAVVVAREQEVGKPVPGDVPVNVRKIARGGKRSGSGRKAGVTNPKSRNNRLMVRLNDRELETVQRRAKAAGLSVPDYQRKQLLA